MLRSLVTAILALGLLSGCVAGGTRASTDVAGLTRDDIAGLSLHQEFDAYRDHYERMQRGSCGTRNSMSTTANGSGAAATTCPGSAETASHPCPAPTPRTATT